jgi:hypothetical protein
MTERTLLGASVPNSVLHLFSHTNYSHAKSVNKEFHNNQTRRNNHGKQQQRSAAHSASAAGSSRSAEGTRFAEEAWEATKVVAAASAAEFTLGFFKAAGIALGTCVVLKMFGVFDKSNS